MIFFPQTPQKPENNGKPHICSCILHIDILVIGGPDVKEWPHGVISPGDGHCHQFVYVHSIMLTQRQNCLMMPCSESSTLLSNYTITPTHLTSQKPPGDPSSFHVTDRENEDMDNLSVAM